jgi:hypothetical protein
LNVRMEIEPLFDSSSMHTIISNVYW